MTRIHYILDRLQEPGSLRSLVLMLFLVQGQVVDNAVLEQTVNGLLILITGISFLMKPTATPTPEAVASAVAAAATPLVQEAIKQAVPEKTLNAAVDKASDAIATTNAVTARAEHLLSTLRR